MSATDEGNKRILVVDDNEFNRDGVALFLRSNGYEVFTAGDEAAAFALAEQTRPWAAVIDIVIPAAAHGKAQVSQSVGLRLVRRLKTLDPTMGVVVFSAYEDRGSDVWDLIRQGIGGLAYMLKGARPDRLLKVLYETAAGAVVLDDHVAANKPQLAQEMRAQLGVDERGWVERAVRLMPTLTPREWDVARRLANSHNLLGIAQELDLSPRTVENHIGHVYDKLGLNTVDTAAPTLRKSMLLTKAVMIYQLLHRDGSHE